MPPRYYYLDASAVVKSLLPESGSQWVQGLLDPSHMGLFASIELMPVEVICALSRAQREGRINLRRKAGLMELFLTQTRALVELLAVAGPVLGRAVRVAGRHPLRSYDAIHLAAALEWAETLSSGGLALPVLVSADNVLLTAAQAEGLAIENPSNYS